MEKTQHFEVLILYVEWVIWLLFVLVFNVNVVFMIGYNVSKPVQLNCRLCPESPFPPGSVSLLSPRRSEREPLEPEGSVSVGYGVRLGFDLFRVCALTVVALKGDVQLFL